MTQRQTSYLAIFVILFFALAITGWFFSNKQQKSIQRSVAGNYDTIMREDKFGQNKKAPTDYYTLALSWSPAFCDLQKQRNNGNVPARLAYQCGDTQQFGWVIHGLWPQNGKARKISDHPRFCKGDLPEIPETVIEKYLPESPGAALLQGQWEKHGACAFDTPEAYFDKQKSLYQQLNLPKYALSKRELFDWLRKNNDQLAGLYFGTNGNELYICYDKSWTPISCPKTQYQ